MKNINVIDIKGIVEKTIDEFCLDYLDNPYLCYTEHGIHALFYYMLRNNIKKNKPKQEVCRYGIHEVCVVQKEYPMAYGKGGEKRANWDISVIKTDENSKPLRISEFEGRLQGIQ